MTAGCWMHLCLDCFLCLGWDCMDHGIANRNDWLYGGNDNKPGWVDLTCCCLGYCMLADECDCCGSVGFCF